MWFGNLENYASHKKICIFTEGVLSEEVRRNFFESGSNLVDSSTGPSSYNGIKSRIYEKKKEVIDRIYGHKQKRVCEGTEDEQNEDEDSLINNLLSNQNDSNLPNFSLDPSKKENAVPSKKGKKKQGKSKKDAAQQQIEDENRIENDEEEYHQQLEMALQMSLKEHI